MSSPTNMTTSDSKVVQITNIGPTVNVEQVRTFLTFIGKLEHLRLYPERPNFHASAPSTKVCYAKFQKLDAAAVALHLTNTVFIDRALIVLPLENGIVPDETEGLKNAYQDKGPSAFSIANPVEDAPEANGYDAVGRTICVDNIPLDVAKRPEELLDFFNAIGEVKFVRLATGLVPTSQAAFVEFTSAESVQAALQHNGSTAFDSDGLVIKRADCAIEKPVLKSTQDAQREIEEAMEQVRKAESVMAASAGSLPIDPISLPGSINRSAFRPRSGSRETSRPPKRRMPTPPPPRKVLKVEEKESSSASRRRSRTRSPVRTRSPDRRSTRNRSHSRDRDRRSDSRSQRRSRDRERDRERESEREKERKRELREREKGRERETERERECRERERDSSRERGRRDRSPNEERSSHKKKHKKEKKRKHKDSSRSRSREKETKGTDSRSKARRSKTPTGSEAPSPANKTEPMETSS